MLGCTVVPATEGGTSLKEAVDSACEFAIICCAVIPALESAHGLARPSHW